jgi:23S rRNA (adenine2503-C2)-methyltransferase
VAAVFPLSVDNPASLQKQNILDFTRAELAADLSQTLSLEPFRAKQLTRWVYRCRALDFGVMTDIAKEVRLALAEHYEIGRLEAKTVRLAEDQTRKYLFALADGELIETVLIRQPARWTLCVSSQVGCALGCKFCRTGEMGFKRNLLASEIVGQVLAVKDDIAAGRETESSNTVPRDFSNIVFMGMGEPLHNLEQVIRAVFILNDNLGLNYSARKITVSTSGLVPAIKQFGQSGAGANLALSLNATTDEVRTDLMPINRTWPIAPLLAALRDYPLKKGRRITIEYVLIHGVNDTPQDLRRLPQLLRGIPVKVNLIPYNGNPATGLVAPPAEHVLSWQEALLDAGVNSTIRWSKGLDIDAACGQLATSYKNQKR